VVIQSVVDRFDPADVVASVERHGATSLLLVGDPMARPVVDVLRREQENGRGRRMPTLRHLLSGGAVLSPTTKADLMGLLPGVTIVDVLGSTESGRQAVARSSEANPSDPAFVPSSTTCVLDEGLTRRLAPGEEALGWLAQTGRVPLGYLGDPERTARTFPVIDGVRHAVPGDRARVLADGRIELLGRDSVCINTGGEKVFAEEVETAVTTHPAVLDAVVCGRPSSRWGEEVVALVALRPGLEVSDDELRDAAGAHLARYKLPRVIVRVDRVERSPSGKADYRWARQRALGDTTIA
jgi:fatty-acyl-CoA synthase